MVVTDLDGTLFQRDRRPSPRNLRTLVELGRRGRLRVIATGRNLFSARKVLPPDFPVDYLLFSSGAGIMDWPAQELLRSVTMGREEVDRAFRALAARRLDFTGKVLTPGMINTHGHMAMTLFRGLVDDRPLEAWLETIWKVEGKYTSPENVAAGARLAMAEMIRGGTTCAADHS